MSFFCVTVLPLRSSRGRFAVSASFGRRGITRKLKSNIVGHARLLLFCRIYCSSGKSSVLPTPLIRFYRDVREYLMQPAGSSFRCHCLWIRCICVLSIANALAPTLLSSICVRLVFFCLSFKTMTRHGKNCTAGAVYTYHEKKKDTGEESAKKVQ